MREDASRAFLSRRQFTLLAGALAAGPSRVFAADAYPSRLVRLIVSSSAGSSPDAIARLVAEEMSVRMGQQMLVDNRPGASTSIGTGAVARSTPDGYTVGYVTPSLVLNRAIGMPLPFDAENDLRAVVQMGYQPVMLARGPSRSFQSVAELVDFARAHPGDLTYASTGPGSILHLAAELFAQSTRTRFVHVPYTSAPQATTDLLGGRIDFMFNAVNALLPNVRAGRLKGLGVSSLTRSVAVPDMPTLDEQGLDHFEVLTWGGFVVPAGVPREVVSYLNATANAALASPAVSRTLTESGYEIVGGSSARFEAFLRSELDKWSEVVKRSGLKLQ
ncbi:MAG: tripartite tricarboxylate transporter substrate-binding protein [Caldimonas sp.]